MSRQPTAWWTCPDPGTPSTNEVSIADNAFNPSNVTITAGQTVTRNPGSPRLYGAYSILKREFRFLNTGNTFLHTFNIKGAEQLSETAYPEAHFALGFVQILILLWPDSSSYSRFYFLVAFNGESCIEPRARAWSR